MGKGEGRRVWGKGKPESYWDKNKHEQCKWRCPVCGERCGGIKGHAGVCQCPTHFMVISGRIDISDFGNVTVDGKNISDIISHWYLENGIDKVRITINPLGNPLGG